MTDAIKLTEENELKYWTRPEWDTQQITHPIEKKFCPKCGKLLHLYIHDTGIAYMCFIWCGSNCGYYRFSQECMTFAPKPSLEQHLENAIDLIKKSMEEKQ